MKINLRTYDDRESFIEDYDYNNELELFTKSRELLEAAGYKVSYGITYPEPVESEWEELRKELKDEWSGINRRVFLALIDKIDQLDRRCPRKED